MTPWTIINSYISGNKSVSAISMIFALALCLTSNAKDIKVIDRLTTQIESYPQEKLHVVTDRDMYCAGDTVWMRVFVVDAADHLPAGLSKYSYVELRNPFNEVSSRVKLIEHDGVFTGYIPLQENLYEGDFTLTAYTAFAENAGEDYFFRKSLRILAPYSSKYSIESEFTPAGEDQVKGYFRLRALRGDKMDYNVMSWTMPDGKTLEMPDAKKGFSKKFSRKQGEDVVLVKFGDYGKYVPVEYPHEKTSVQFFPEGGWLIAGEPCRIAFKAVDESGRGVALTGTVKDYNGTEITTFTTSHNGMGSFRVVPEHGTVYHAEFRNPDLTTSTVEIGEAKEGAAALRYGSSASRALFSVAGGDGMDLELIIACRGKGILASDISKVAPISLNKADLPTGLYQAMLLSRGDSAVVSERLFFIGADRTAPTFTSISVDSTKLKLKSPVGTGADCSLRIVHPNMAKIDDKADIRTQLLLQGELRGRIEDPAYYFNHGNRNADRDLDLLMMINGWSRYNLPEVILGKYSEPEIPLEIGQEISGQVRSRWRNRPLEGVMVYAISPKMNFGMTTETDASGEFHFDGFDFPEETPFIIRAINEKGDSEGNFDIYDEQFPESGVLPAAGRYPSSETEVSDFFKDGRWTMLGEIKVQAYKEKEKDIFEILAASTKTAEDFEARGITTLSEAFRGIPGVYEKADRLYSRGKPVEYFIDGILFNPHNGRYKLGSTDRPKKFKSARAGRKMIVPGLTEQDAIPEPEESPVQTEDNTTPLVSEVNLLMPFEHIGRIDFLRHSVSSGILGSRTGGGAIMITTKEGNPRKVVQQFDLKDYLPLGYQRYKEFSSPLLSVNSDIYDLKTTPTLLWIPSLKFGDAGKEITLAMPVPVGAEIIVEGISDNGPVMERIR